MVLISKQIAYFSHVIGMLLANFIKFVEMNMCLFDKYSVILNFTVKM